jgi:hypothetical protein
MPEKRCKMVLYTSGWSAAESTKGNVIRIKM